jgi:hypothetical protein
MRTSDPKFKDSIVQLVGVVDDAQRAIDTLENDVKILLAEVNAWRARPSFSWQSNLDRAKRRVDLSGVIARNGGNK